ncbi:MAG: LacI family DNA-binding transcriptional regulator [Victivallales bacterium]|nr:LacI family DNA-binding transcriptional regulator [Victivallales bacterium]
MGATIKELAANLGLSHSVVSRALNSNPDANARVAPKTKRLVEREACRIGYRRNRSAEFMRRGRSAAIGVFLPSYSNSHIADLVMGMSEVANKHGFPVSLNFGLTLDSYEAFFRSNIANPSSGIISYPFAIDADAEVERLFASYIESGGKGLLLNASGPRGVPVLRMDDAFGARIAAKRLMSRGCERYFAVGGFSARTEAFFAEIVGRGGECAEIALDDLDELSLIIDAAEFPVGFFAVTDEIAIVLMNRLRRLGFKIGSDVLVIGYDDLHLTALLDPSLTTIHQSFRQQGARSVEKLLNMIYGKEESADELTVPFLVERESA